MQRTMIRSKGSGQLSDAEFADIDCELSCSAREAGVGFASFTNLDFVRAAMEYALVQAGKGTQHFSPFDLSKADPSPRREGKGPV